MTVPRILVGVAVLLGLLSTGLGKTMRLENGSWPTHERAQLVG